MWLNLIMIAILTYLAWRVWQLEKTVEALARLYNELANLFDERFDNDNQE